MTYGMTDGRGNTLGSSTNPSTFAPRRPRSQTREFGLPPSLYSTDGRSREEITDAFTDSAVKQGEEIYIVAGGVCECDKGVEPAVIVASNLSSATFAGREALTVSCTELISTSGEEYFGTCRVRTDEEQRKVNFKVIDAIKCKDEFEFTTDKWEPGIEVVESNGEAIIGTHSKLKCVHGGKISIIDNGQNGNVKYVNEQRKYLEMLLNFGVNLLIPLDEAEMIWKGRNKYTYEENTIPENTLYSVNILLYAFPYLRALSKGDDIYKISRGGRFGATALNSSDDFYDLAMSRYYADDIYDSTKGARNAEKASEANVISKYDDLYTYKYNGYDNPGPLNEVRGQPNKNFYGGRYDMEVLKEPKVYYRGGDSTSPLGQWFTETPPSSVAEVRINSAVKPQWLDKNGVLMGTSTIDTVYKVEIPAGTTIYKGPVGNQGGIYQGGLNNNQVFIQEPWLLDKVNILGKQPLK